METNLSGAHAWLGALTAVTESPRPIHPVSLLNKATRRGVQRRDTLKLTILTELEI